MKRFLFSVAIIIAASVSAQAQGSCIVHCDIGRFSFWQECIERSYYDTLRNMYNYYTGEQEYPDFGDLDILGCEDEADMRYQKCVLDCERSW